MIECPCRRVLQLSHENERKGLLPGGCRVGVKRVRAKTIQAWMIEVECIGNTYGNILSEPWYESDNCVTRQAASDSRTAGCTLASSWLDCEA